MIPVNMNRPLIRNKMAQVKKQMWRLTHQKKVLPQAIYYDQMEELRCVFHKMKLQEKAIIDAGVLEVWCEEHPGDLECRLYE